MQVKHLRLKNFRNYKESFVEFQAGKNIVIGENAQGKTNLLEAVELAGSGKSSRASEERELMGWGESKAQIEIEFSVPAWQDSQSISLEWQLKEGSSNSRFDNAAASPSSAKKWRCQKLIKVNGLVQSSIKGLLGHLLTVSFASSDLKILRGGPKYRRDWLDSISLRLQPAFHDVLSAYAKSLAQRNRLLKTLAEKGRLAVADQDELLVWDKQLAKYGTLIIKQRLKLLGQVLPLAEEKQSMLSGQKEKLSIDYAFKARQENQDSFDDDDESESYPECKSMEELESVSREELAVFLLKLMKERRYIELRRRQSLIGPHRDNLIFKLNGADAVAFASQGQQRSIVLSLKLAELKKIQDDLGQTPILLLDDVLAELDEKRAALLLAGVTEGMQTILSTTHLSGIGASWLENARIMTVHQGELLPSVLGASS